MKKQHGPAIRFTGRLYEAARRMQHLSEKINELEGTKMLSLFEQDLREIEYSITEFEEWWFDFRVKKKGAAP